MVFFMVSRKRMTENANKINALAVSEIIEWE